MQRERFEWDITVGDKMLTENSSNINAPLGEPSAKALL